MNSLSNPYDPSEMNQENELDSCCICMEDFETAGPDSDRAVDNELGVAEPNTNVMVVLPCKAHFFHEVCISSWILK